MIAYHCELIIIIIEKCTAYTSEFAFKSQAIRNNDFTSYYKGSIYDRKQQMQSQRIWFKSTVIIIDNSHTYCVLPIYDIPSYMCDLR